MSIAVADNAGLTLSYTQPGIVLNFACIDERRINLLVIGGTGVGKSTWINAFANYCSYETLDKAEADGGRFPISSTFEINHPQTGNFISISSECNDFTPISQFAEVGESVTQIPNEYVFQYQKTKICIIDTPGLLDTKDVGTYTHNTDKEHVNNILRLLSSYNEIHAICILLKANETRLSDAFQYIITEILRHLDKNASNNIIFVFTFAASTNFKPHTTQSILEKFLTEIELPIPLPPNKATVYCFESDSVQYLVERKNGIPPEEYDKKHATENWERSTRSTAEMIRYVCSLNPLPLDRINAIYDAECTIGMLSKLVLETLQCVANNVSELESKKEEAKKMKARLRISPRPTRFQESNDYKAMWIDKLKIVRKELGFVNVVCEAPKCVSIFEGEPVYTQICCRGCQSLFIYFCKVMNFRGNCKCCGCSKSMHHWTRTESKIVTERVSLVQEKTDRIQEASQTVEPVVNDIMLDINTAITECENRLQMYRSETEQMLKMCAKLNTYVTQTALIASCGVDEMKRNLENRIATYEKAKLGKGLTDLKRIRYQYEQYLGEEKFIHYTPSDVQELIQSLYNMPMNGKDLKDAMLVEDRARRTVADVKRKANPVMVLAEFCGQFISKVMPAASWLYKQFERM